MALHASHFFIIEYNSAKCSNVAISVNPSIHITNSHDSFLFMCIIFISHFIYNEKT